MTIVVTGSARGLGRHCLQTLRALEIPVVGFDRSCDVDSELLDVRQADAFRGRLRSLPDVTGFVGSASLSARHPDPKAILDVNFRALGNNLFDFFDLATPGSAAVLFSSIAAERYDWNSLSHTPTLRWLEEGIPDSVLRSLSATTAYSYSKHLVRCLTRDLAREGATRGCRVNCILLGPTEGEEFDEMLISAPDKVADLRRECPMPLPIPRDAVSKLVSLLLSPAMGHMTAATIRLDAGWSLDRSRPLAMLS